MGFCLDLALCSLHKICAERVILKLPLLQAAHVPGVVARRFATSTKKTIAQTTVSAELPGHAR